MLERSRNVTARVLMSALRLTFYWCARVSIEGVVTAHLYAQIWPASLSTSPSSQTQKARRISQTFLTF